MKEVTLTSEQVEEIRSLARESGASLGEIARRYKIDVGHVRFIANRNRKVV